MSSEMYLHKFFTIFSVVCLSIHEIWCPCPHKELIEPCYCDHNEIICWNPYDKPMSLDQIFLNLERNLSKGEKHFDFIYLKDRSIYQLNENQFRDITFYAIKIQACINMTTIHENAFNYTDQVTKRVHFLENFELAFPGGSIYDILKKFKRAEFIEIMESNINTIPTHAFDISQVWLKELVFTGLAFNTIQNNAFATLSNLKSIKISRTSITTITGNAFHFDRSTESILLGLKITLDSNPYITSKSFENNTLININRPVFLTLTTTEMIMQYLNEQVYLPFLKTFPENMIKLETQLNCSDSRNQWFINNKELSARIEFSCLIETPSIDYIDPGATIQQGDCPKADLLEPCVCDFTGIQCIGNEIKDLDQIFEKLETNLDQAQKHFQIIHLRNTSITELKENQFRDITFDEINIEFNNYLKTIHENAFNGTEQTIVAVKFETNPALTFSTGSIFDILSKFENVRIIEIIDSNVETIPSNAFKSNQEHLCLLSINEPLIKSIEDNAFSKLKNLGYLTLSEISIELLPEYAFHFEDSNKQGLCNIENEMISINILGSNLDSSIFYNKVLLSINRYPIRVAILNSNNSWNYLDESIFNPFLKINSENKLGAHLDLNCSDCRNYWLYNDQDVLRQIFQTFRYSETFCANGKPLTDSGNFVSCQ